MHAESQRVKRADSEPYPRAGRSSRQLPAGHQWLLRLQRTVGNAAVQRLLRQPDRGPFPPIERGQAGVLQRIEGLTGLATLDGLLERFDVPEQQVITHLAGLSTAEKSLVLAMDSYRSKLVGAMNAGELARSLDALNAPLPVALEWLLAAGTSYAWVKPRILLASAAERASILGDQVLLRALRDELGWHDFAKSMELLGRAAPDRATLLADPTVRAQLEAAWLRSNPGVRVVPVQGPPIHEEGGFIYLNLITNTLHFELRSGGPFDFSDRLPPAVEDAIVVGTFHTHPQLGQDFERTPSIDGDIPTGISNGVPGLIRTEENGQAVFYEYGPDVRLHLAGASSFRSWSYPGAAGGQAP
jgi:hypothetical protein